MYSINDIDLTRIVLYEVNRHYPFLVRLEFETPPTH